MSSEAAVRADLAVDRTSRARLAAQAIASAIYAGTFRPGQQLAEEELARQFNVSRIPIREALRELYREGLVELIPRRGAFVAAMDRTEAAEIYDIRALLEGYAAKLCAAHIDRDGLSEMTELLSQMRSAVESGEVDRYSDLSLQFRSVIWENTPNRVAREIVRQLARRSLRLRSIAMRLPDRLQESLASHEQLLEAFRERDAATAEMVRWLSVQQAKRALVGEYFADAVRPERRSQLERDLPELVQIASRLEQSIPTRPTKR